MLNASWRAVQKAFVVDATDHPIWRAHVFCACFFIDEENLA
jgi:hypothetical protein